MKRLIVIGGTMGVGKTSVCRALQTRLDNNVFLDGDWCWDMRPFSVTDETKAMVMDNIQYLLNSFLCCSAYENIVFCWVLHEQAILDQLLAGLDTQDCDVRCFSLICREEPLVERLTRDVENGLRAKDVIARSVSRIPLYDALHTVHIDTSDISVSQVAERILSCL